MGFLDPGAEMSAFEEDQRKKPKSGMPISCG